MKKDDICVHRGARFGILCFFMPSNLVLKDILFLWILEDQIKLIAHIPQFALYDKYNSTRTIDTNLYISGNYSIICIICTDAIFILVLHAYTHTFIVEYR